MAGTAGSAAGADAGELEADAGAELAAAEEGAEDDAGVLVSGGPTDKPHRLSTAMRSKSSAERMPAFLMRRCFFRRSLRATRRASCTSFIAFCMAALASAMESSKSMRGRFARFLAAGASATLPSGATLTSTRVSGRTAASPSPAALAITLGGASGECASGMARQAEASGDA